MTVTPIAVVQSLAAGALGYVGSILIHSGAHAIAGLCLGFRVVSVNAYPLCWSRTSQGWRRDRQRKGGQRTNGFLVAPRYHHQVLLRTTLCNLVASVASIALMMSALSTFRSITESKPSLFALTPWLVWTVTVAWMHLSWEDGTLYNSIRSGLSGLGHVSDPNLKRGLEAYWQIYNGLYWECQRPMRIFRLETLSEVLLLPERSAWRFTGLIWRAIYHLEQGDPRGFEDLSHVEKLFGKYSFGPAWNAHFWAHVTTLRGFYGASYEETRTAYDRAKASEPDVVSDYPTATAVVALLEGRREDAMLYAALAEHQALRPGLGNPIDELEMLWEIVRRAQSLEPTS